MKTLRFSAFLLLILIANLAAVFASEPVSEILFDFERAGQIWQKGETPPVTITVLGSDNTPVNTGTLTVEMTNDGRDLLSSSQFDLSQKNPITVNASLPFPGILQIKASVTSEGTENKTERLAGLAFDPESIQPGLPKPRDFDEFWEKGKAEVRALPLDLEIVPIKEFTTDKREVQQIRFRTIGDTYVYAFLSKPVGDGPFPGIVTVPGAGQGDTPDGWLADQGFAVLKLNVFPFPISLDPQVRKDDYDRYNSEHGSAYYFVNSNDRDTYFYHPIYLGLDRAIDWFAEQPYVDRTRIGFLGTSQGGGSALILSGMNKNIKAAVASVPALCDHAGQLTGRSSGWPGLVKESGDDKAVLEASRYLDAVNFARSITIPIRVTVGFIDNVCSPSSVWAAYNVIPSADKQILPEPKLGHQNGSQYNEASQWLFDFLKEKE